MSAHALKYLSSSQAVTKSINREPYFLERSYYDALQLINPSLANLSVYMQWETVHQIEKSKNAAALIAGWLKDPSNYDETVYPELEKALKSGTMRCREE